MQIITNLTNLLSHVENKPEIFTHHEITFVGNRPLDYEETRIKKDNGANDFEDDGMIAW